jgi:hypothetical protein
MPTSTAHAQTGVYTCVGWWAFHWDSPQTGQVQIVAEYPYNQCANLYALWPAPGCETQCIGSALFSGGQFVAPVGPGDRCDVLFNVGGPYPMVVAGGVLVTGNGIASGAIWHLNGAFAGHTCLDSPTRGLFTFVIEVPL